MLNMWYFSALKQDVWNRLLWQRGLLPVLGWSGGRFMARKREMFNFTSLDHHHLRQWELPWLKIHPGCHPGPFFFVFGPCRIDSDCRFVTCGGFRKWGHLQIIQFNIFLNDFNRIFHYTSSNLSSLMDFNRIFHNFHSKSSNLGYH